MRLCDYHHKDHEPFAGTDVNVTLGNSPGNRPLTVDGKITRSTRTMVYVRYTAHPGTRPQENRFWKKDGLCVGDKKGGVHGPRVTLKGVES